MDYRASLLPADKVSAVNELNAHAPLAMVGDGINDVPAMEGQLSASPWAAAQTWRSKPPMRH